MVGGGRGGADGWAVHSASTLSDSVSAVMFDLLNIKILTRTKTNRRMMEKMIISIVSDADCDG